MKQRRLRFRPATVKKAAAKRAVWRLQAEMLAREKREDEERRESLALARAYGAS